MSIVKHAFIDGNSLGLVTSTKLNDDHAIQARFASVTEKLREEQKKRGAKELSPYVDDFLYASCIMMHAAESALINQETGEIVKNAKGEPVTGYFEKYDSSSGRETIRWVSPDGIRPTKNNNGDIFPETELVKAHKNWIGKPLCKDHVSNSVDGIRGVIVDTYYDPKFKRVHALFALDRKNYPDLARKLEAGYATNVSMGTAVGRSVCTECQNVATVASEFCNHVKSRTHYGEINLDLNPIELSIVVTGADPRAKIRKIIASLDEYRAQADALRKVKGAPLEVIAAVDGQIDDLEGELLAENERSAESFSKDQLSKLITAVEVIDPRIDSRTVEDFESFVNELLSYIEKFKIDEVYGTLKEPREQVAELLNALARIKKLSSSEDNKKRANSLVVPLARLSIREAPKDNFMQSSAAGSTSAGDDALSGIGKRGPATLSPTDTFSAPTGYGPFDRGDESGRHGLTPGIFETASVYKDIPLKKDAFEHEKGSNAISERITSIKNTLDSLKSCLPTQKAGVGTGDIMSFDELRKRANLRKKAYMQGTEEPKSYPAMGNPNLREDDHHLHGEELDTSVDNPDQKTKEMLLRASLDERRAARAEKLKALGATVVKDTSGKVAGVLKQDGGKETFVPAHMAYDSESDESDAYDQCADDEDADDQDANDLMTAQASLMRRLELLKEAAKKKAKNGKDKDKKDKEMADKKKMTDKKTTDKKMTDKKMTDKMNKKAYPQGTAEPETYKPMGNPDLRDDDHHLGGKVLDTKSDNPDQKVKELIQRAGLKARLSKSANLANSRWTVYANETPVFSVKAADAYNVHLDRQSDVPGKTWGELFNSADYGKQLIAQIRAGNLSKLAADLQDAQQSVMAPLAGAEASPADVSAADAAATTPMVNATPEAPEAPEAPPADDMTDKLKAAVEKMEGCMAEIKSLAFGTDEGVADLDVAKAVTASQKNAMFEAHAELASLASELRFLMTDGDLTKSSVRLAARAAIRDSHLAAIEANERIAELKAGDEQDAAYALDPEELDEVADAVNVAIHEHEDSPSHEDLEKALQDLKDELAALEESVEEVEEKLEDMSDEEEEEEEEEEESDAMDMTARAAMRQQLVARAAKMDSASDPMLNPHKGEGDLGLPSSGDADSKVQNVFEVHDAAMAVVSDKVKKAAAGIADAIRKGALSESQLDSLVAVAAVDAEAVKYYREYFGKVDSEFAKGLVSEFKKSASSNEDIGFRYKRAYAVAIDAQARGLISSGRAALDECAETLATGSDSNFDSFKRMVSSVKLPARTAGVVPQMGIVEASDNAANVRTASEGASVDVRDWRSLGKALFDI